MKKLVFLGCLVGLSLTATAQNKWSLQVNAEETIMLGDASTTAPTGVDGAFDWLAANSGIRFGGFYQYNDDLSLEFTLGVSGSSGTSDDAMIGDVLTKHVPLEAIAHYNILPYVAKTDKYRFNADLGLGSGLIIPNGSFGWGEYFAWGASLEFPAIDQLTLSIGFRNSTYLFDEGADGDPNTDGLDNLLRFYTGGRVNLGVGNEIREQLAAAEAKAAELGSALENSEKKLEEEAAAKDALMEKLDGVKAELATALENQGTDEAAGPSVNVSLSIHFELGSSEIAQTDIPDMMTIAHIMAEDANLKATIIGHTDASGSDEVNAALSLARAEAVKAWLVAEGIAGDRLTTQGEGAAMPHMIHGEDVDPAINRRAEVIFK